MTFASIYQSALAGLAVSVLPKILYDNYKKDKYRSSMRQRLGKDLPPIKDPDAPLIWFHAVSMGETKAIAKLCQLIKQRHPQVSLLISSTTETGHQEAIRSIAIADYHIYLPIDFSPVIGPVIRHFKPKAVLLSETDIWWNFLRQAKEQGAFVGVVNGKLSERSSNRLNILPSLGKKIYSPLDFCCAQTDEYATRFSRLGVPHVSVSGNTKFDLQPSQKPIPLEIPPGTELIVAGSTHPTEEEIIIKQLTPLLKERPNLRLAIVPRHPDRFNDVAKYLETTGFPVKRFTQEGPSDWKILLVDAMGILANLYGAAKVAIVCGSFTPKVGGHNILEPCFAGTPVLFGPHMFTQNEMTALVDHYETGLACTENNLGNNLSRLLDNPHELATLKKNCATLSRDIQGATERTYEAIHPWLKRHIDGK